MKKQLEKHLLKRVNQCVGTEKLSDDFCKKNELKVQSHKKRNAEIVKVKAKGKIKKIEKDTREGNEPVDKVLYTVHFQYLIKQKEEMYIEEEVEERIALFQNGEIVEEKEIVVLPDELDVKILPIEEKNYVEERQAFKYDRLAAVKYAERWWNEYNPSFKKFDVDCTNYISQCLYAGKAPMVGYPNRNNGWWMKNNNWSYSWTVSNALQSYLKGAKKGLRGKEVSDPSELQLGDVIFYDFQGDGRFDHTTIVTGKDREGMPLVNAHTSNSRMRYWAYEDSTAYTPKIKYKFIHIVDDQ